MQKIANQIYKEFTKKNVKNFLSLYAFIWTLNIFEDSNIQVVYSFKVLMQVKPSKGYKRLLPVMSIFNQISSVKSK